MRIRAPKGPAAGLLVMIVTCMVVYLCKGSVMVPRLRNAMTTQTLRRSREPVSVLLRVSVSGPITALAAASP